MKKVLATVAALGLVLGVTANALALDQPGRAQEVEATTAPRVAEPTAPGVALWSVAGQWVLAGAYLSNGLGAPGGADLWNSDGSNDAFYIYSFKMLPVLQVNDKIAVKGEFRFADRDVFGLTDTRKTLVGTGLAGEVSDLGGRVIDTYQLYMEGVSPWGKTRFGRTPAGAWGSKFLDNSAQGNRLMIWLNMLPENWGSLLFTQKVREEDAGSGPGVGDQDLDGYYIDLSYKADFGKTVAALWTARNATGGQVPYTSTNLWVHGNYNFDAISLEYEINWGFGEASATLDQKQLGLYADLGYKFQDWKFGGLFIYASGDDNPADGDQGAMMSLARGTGGDFNPTQILFGDYMNLLNGDNPLAGDGVYPEVRNAGVMALEGYASFALSPAMSLNGYLAWATANEELSGWDSDYGIEAGIGMGYKLMDNLTYNAHFSYLFTGDFWQGGDSTQNTEDIYLLAHALSMSF
jgi:hypothetical protein